MLKLNILNRKILFILFIVIIAFISSSMLIEQIYSQTYIGSCRPLFPNPLWGFLDASLASVIAIVLIRIFKIDYTIVELIIVINFYLLLKGFIYFSTVYAFDYSWFFHALLSEYATKKTLLFSLNFLALGFLLMRK